MWKTLVGMGINVMEVDDLGLKSVLRDGCNLA
jgi:hypothetical protein